MSVASLHPAGFQTGVFLGKQLLADQEEDSESAVAVDSYVADLEEHAESTRTLQANAQARLLAADLTVKPPEVYGVLIERGDDGELTLDPYDDYGHSARRQAST